MILLDIPPNPNCDATERVFHDVEAPRAIARMRLEREGAPAAWYDVTGWTAAGAPCPALAQKIDDSGEGVAFLIYGGDAGLRFRPADAREPWDLSNPHQWGEPFIITPDLNDLQLATAGKKIS